MGLMVWDPACEVLCVSLSGHSGVLFSLVHHEKQQLLKEALRNRSLRSVDLSFPTKNLKLHTGISPVY